MHRLIHLLVCLGFVQVAAADGDATPPATATTTAPAPAPAPEEGATLRNGFSFSLGEEVGSGPSSGLTGQLYGGDWRIGAKLSDSLAVYLDTHLSFGTAKIGGTSGVTGNFASAIIGEYTLPQRVFFGGGAGYGVLNNPSGPLAQLRAGWYPMSGPAAGKARRLNLAVDARWYFAGDMVGTVTQVAVTFGYDRF